MHQGSLLDSIQRKPLADQMRPQASDEVIGQSHILAPGKALYHVLQGNGLHSMVLWGPPGTGKTSLARLVSQKYNYHFISLSAVLVGVKEVRQAIIEAKNHHQGTLLFIDEVHRFNKNQQDAFLPHIEDGTIVFIGATTENPSFELNSALLSRLRVYVFNLLSEHDLMTLLGRAMSKHRDFEIEEKALEKISRAANGDARQCLNLLEVCLQLCEEEKQLSEDIVDKALSGEIYRFDKRGDEFYNLISALHKSIRGSDPDAALYWLCRMLAGGCDEQYIARRLTRMASEDIGNADPRALSLALDAWQAQERLGSPEGHLALAQAVCYLASVPKSNAVYMAFKRAQEDARRYASLPVPRHLCNAPTELMKNVGNGKGYRYAHDEVGGYAAGENYLPDKMRKQNYYQPVNRGLEQKIKQRLDELADLDEKWSAQHKAENTEK